MSSWNDSEKIAREQLNLSEDYSLEMASIEVSDIDLDYRDDIFDQMEEDPGYGPSTEMIMEIIDKHITYIKLPTGMMLVKMTAKDQPDVWGFIQLEVK